MEQANMDIRKFAKKKGIMLWQIATEIGVSESTMTRMLRREITPKKREEIIEIINRLAEGV